MGAAASPAAAVAVDPQPAHSTSLTQSGSGTVSDPWIPSRNAHTDCQSTGLYGNYYGGLHRDWILDMPFNRYLQVRYLTSDGRSADVFYVYGSQWGFAPTSCFHFT